MNKINIAVIDSGFDGTQLNNGAVVSKNFTDEESMTDQNGHGSCIVKLIDALCNQASIYSFKVLKRDNRGHLSALKQALWASLEDNIDIINLSLGFDLPETDQELNEIMDRCRQKNIVIVNTNSDSTGHNWLNQYQGVLNIRGGAGLDKDLFYYSAGSFYISNLPRIVPWLNGQYIMTAANSFLTPYLVKKAFDIMKIQKISIDALRLKLIKEAILVNKITCSHQINEVDRQIDADQQLTAKLHKKTEGLDLYDAEGKLRLSAINKKTTTVLMNIMNEFIPNSFMIDTIYYQDIIYIENLANKIHQISNNLH